MACGSHVLPLHLCRESAACRQVCPWWEEATGAMTAVTGAWVCQGLGFNIIKCTDAPSNSSCIIIKMSHVLILSGFRVLKDIYSKNRYNSTELGLLTYLGHQWRLSEGNNCGTEGCLELHQPTKTNRV